MGHGAAACTLAAATAAYWLYRKLNRPRVTLEPSAALGSSTTAAASGTIMPSPANPGPDGSQMYVDLGVYGLPTCVTERPTCHGFDMINSMRIYEARLRQIGGVEMLYADIFCTKEEFESMYPHKGYRELRAKYGAVGAFPEVYDKINNPEKKAKAAATKSK